MRRHPRIMIALAVIVVLFVLLVRSIPSAQEKAIIDTQYRERAFATAYAHANPHLEDLAPTPHQ